MKRTLFGLITTLALAGCANTIHTYSYNLDTAAGHYSQWAYQGLGHEFNIELFAKYTIKRESTQWAPTSVFYLSDDTEKNSISVRFVHDNSDERYRAYVIDSAQKTESNPQAIIFEFTPVDFEKTFNLGFSASQNRVEIRLNEEQFQLNTKFTPARLLIGNSSGEIQVKEMKISNQVKLSNTKEVNRYKPKY